MTTNNSNNIDEQGVVYNDGSGSFEGVNLQSGEIMVGDTGAEPVVIDNTFMEGENCWFCNLSFNHSAGTFTITGADGTALSASNPAYVIMQSNASTGRLVRHTITADLTMTISDLDGNLGYTISGNNLTSPLPLYVGLVATASDASLTGFISWLPGLTNSPFTDTNIGNPSFATADKQFSIFVFNDAIARNNYEQRSTGLIGSLSATKNGSDEWTFQTIDPIHEGVGKWNNRRCFTYGGGLYGTGTASIFANNGGTAPAFSSNVVDRFISSSGFMRFYYDSTGDGGTDGSGNVTTFTNLTNNFAENPGYDFITMGSGIGRLTNPTMTKVIVPGTREFFNFYQLINTSGVVTKNNQYSNGDREVKMYTSMQVKNYEQ